MKTKFSGYYELTEEEFCKLWNDCVFVFDTNVLLDFYRVSYHAQNSLWQMFDLIKERIWIPYQVAKEYHRDILDVIIQQEKKCEDAINELEKLKNKVIQSFSNGRSFPHIGYDLKEKIVDVCEELAECISKEKNGIDDLFNNNPTKERLSKLLDNKLGEQFSEKDLEEIYKKGKSRYEKKIPPGYADNKKQGNDIYGDFVIWQEIIRYAQKENRDIILITSDNKEDWFNKKYKGKTTGPRSELRMEFKKETGRIYYAYALPNFLENMKKYLKTSETISSAVIEEVAAIDLEETESMVNKCNEGEIDCITEEQFNSGEI